MPPLQAVLGTQPPYSTDLEAFKIYIQGCNRILALAGAGLSAASDLPTFRGAGGLWREYNAMALATPESFDDDPGLVWQFYGWRREMSLQAQPNAAHYALAKLAELKPNFNLITQNVDGLSPRVNHKADQIHYIHGDLFDMKCNNEDCDWIQKKNFNSPVFPALTFPKEGLKDMALATSDNTAPLPKLEEIPRCPECKTGLQRPGVVWFGEGLPEDTLDKIDEFINKPEKIDLMLVIGTSATVQPAASYVNIAKKKGAKVAVVNMDNSSLAELGVAKDDWFFGGDAATLLPQMLEPVIGATSSSG